MKKIRFTQKSRFLAFLKHWPHRDSVPTWQQLATIAQWQSINCVIRWGLGTIVSGCWGQAKKLPLIIVLALFLLLLKEKVKYFHTHVSIWSGKMRHMPRGPYVQVKWLRACFFVDVGHISISSVCNLYSSWMETIENQTIVRSVASILKRLWWKT